MTMNKSKIFIATIVTILLLGIVATVTNASDKVQLQQVDLKTKGQEIQIKTKKADELQKRLEDAHGDLEKLKTIEEENKKLQDEIKALQAKKAEKARLAALEQKSLAERAVNAVTGTQTAYAATGSHSEWMTAAGIPIDQQAAAETLVQRESSWNVNAYNSIGACSLVQALPCSKIPGDWRDPVTALKWGNGYVAARYGSWQAALAHSYAQNWY